jgi:hypothetical protein
LINREELFNKVKIGSLIYITKTHFYPPGEGYINGYYIVTKVSLNIIYCDRVCYTRYYDPKGHNKVHRSDIGPFVNVLLVAA